MLPKVRRLASDALDALRGGDRIPIRESHAFIRCAGRCACPKYQISPRVTEVIVTFEVPGATVENTELYWNPELHTLCLQVAPPREHGEHLRVVLAFTSDVDGASGSGVLKDGILRVRLPRRDVDTFTALPEMIRAEAAGFAAPLCP